MPSKLNCLLDDHVDDLVHDFVDGCLLVAGARDDVLVVCGDVAAEHGRGFLGLEDGGSVGRAPGVEQVVLAGGDEPLAGGGELEAEHARLVQMKLVLVGLVDVQHLHVGALHAHREPLARGAEAQREDLAGEVVLLQLAPLAQVPRADCVVESSGPQLGAVGGDVDAGGAVGVALELPDEGLVVQVPHRDVAVAAAAEAHLHGGEEGDA